MTQFTVSFGDFLCTQQTKPAILKAKKPVTKYRDVEVWEEEVIERPILREVRIGCSPSCEALKAYTKSSFRRAIKEQDLTPDGRCVRCSMLARVGEARKHIQGFLDVEVVTQKHLVTKEEAYIDYEEVDVEAEEDYMSYVLLTPGWQNIYRKPELETSASVAEHEKEPAPVVLSEDNKNEMVTAMESSFWTAYMEDFNRKGLALKARQRVEEEREAQIWKKLETELAVREANRPDSRLFTNKYGTFYKPYTKRNKRSKWYKKLKRRENEMQLSKMDVAIVKNIENPLIMNCDVPFEPLESNVRKLPTMKRTKKDKILKNRIKYPVDDLVKALMNIASKKEVFQVNILGNGKRKANQIAFRQGMRPKLMTKHHRGIIKRRDLIMNPHCTDIERIIFDKISVKTLIHVSQIKVGDSGTVINKQCIQGNFGRTPDNFLIVRGMYEGKLFDARSKLTYTTCMRMLHYSDTASKFWKGFDESFRSLRLTQDPPHECVTNLDVEECGRVAAIVSQTIFPCWKITCETCAKKNENVDKNMFERLQMSSKIIRTNHPKFTHVMRFLEREFKSIQKINTNFEAFASTQKLIGHRKDGPFGMLNELNSLIVRASQLDEQEFARASDIILELARWHNNRTESILKGDLRSFRNKATGKTQINMTLMCDNQRDQNGNFKWGERGRHAKRIFKNYFEIINPMDGYDKYIERFNINSVRKLAIGKLIIPLDPHEIRESMNGEPVKSFNLDTHCVSKLNGNFVYQACCVTHEDGTPVKSSVIMPTKNHLVIGNTGDAKYVDLPQADGINMYIAKKGYCYLNIFLAMLVNVNEGGAKNFTKMVRDLVIPKLKTWPTLIDLATMCYFISVFHPETKNAELPRILVDHENCTMHVVDSYGSLNTGYHILKASTVNQLIAFASNSLESEMKMYQVGGLSRTFGNVQKTLFRSIYRPKEMRILIQDEPYLLFMGMMSPSVLLALHTNKHLESAINYWIQEDTNLALAISTLNQLAKKVSLAESLNSQFHIMHGVAPEMIQRLKYARVAGHSRDDIIESLKVISQRDVTNWSLHKLGYFTENNDLNDYMEKSYQTALKDAWKELSVWEKLCSIYHSPPASMFVRSNYIQETLNASLTQCRALPQKCFAESVRYCSKVACTGLKRVKEKCTQTASKIFQFSLNTIMYFIPDIVKFVNVIFIIHLLLMITKNAHELTQTRKIEREKLLTLERQNSILELEMLHKEMVYKMKQNPTEDEFLEEVSNQLPRLLPLAKILIGKDEDEVEFQARRSSEAYLEKTVAFVALVLMIFDNEKSDCVYKVLNKVKSLVSVADSDVYHQSLDDIQEISIEKKLTIDFELAGTSQVQHLSTEKSFNQWWDNQLANNRVIPHYRIGGKFLEFTREKASEVAYTISHEQESEYLIRGAVGSGKSTGLPNQLSLKGSVLLLEPTRPLTENVARQLRTEPFFLNPTVRMRGLSSFGSTPITIMTTGFAFSFYVVNIPLLKTVDFIIFDECHVLDGQAMAFYALLKEINYGGKILKVSATPPGRECEFTTQYPVTIKTEDSLSFQAFVGAQGTGSNADVISHGDNILVYVASYNEVDTLSRMLIDKGHSVTKVDGRTMKVGSVEITTHGTPNKKHFVVATNIIENGVTLDIDVVVDFGTRVTAELDSDSRCISYTKHPICYGERIQRLGRVGRNKPGLALRIGHTEKGMVNIPSIVASQAALACFAHGLPVMTHNVSTSILGGCTVRQAQAMSNFELSPFFLLPFIKTDGSMHPEIHNLLKPYKLRESEMVLSERAIPESGSGQWTQARDYHRIGLAKGVHEDVKIFFYVKDVPDKLYEQLWDTIKIFKPQCQFQSISSASSVKIAHTLQTDIHAIHRTISHIDHLLEEERTKQAHFQAVSSRSCSGSSFSFLSISNAIRAHWMKDYSAENIEKLQRAKAQLLDFQSLSIDPSVPSNLKSFEALDCVYHQSATEISQKLQLKGKWNKSLITRDVIVILGVLIGGIAIIMQKFKHDWNEDVYHQASGKNQRNRLKFRESRDKKFGNMVYGDAVERYFGDAYTNKPKKKGEKRGMGLKTKKFYTMYGYDPAEYNFIRFLDPLTGCTIDENPFIDFQLVADEFMDQRIKLRNEDKLENEQIVNNNTLHAYYVNNSAKKALRIDLTPHKPLMYCENKHTIAGYPEMEGVFRQTGQKMEIDIEDVPKPQGIDEVKFEGKSLHRGMRDYNGIAAAVCKLTNESEGEAMSLYGVGFGSLILTNQHLFKKNNGDLIIRSRHGLFRLKDTKNLECFPIKGKDLVVLRLPQDFPPFPTKIKFRKPISDEAICIIGNSFQEKSNATLVSESGKTYPKDHGDFWKHWISTKDGQCGSPIVSTTDGFIVGLHSLSNLNNTINYFAGLEDDFAEKYLDLQVHREWRRGWAYNPNNISWGNLNIHESKPDGLFKITKTVTDLIHDDVYPQGEKRKWMCDSISGNLQAIAETSAQLVTKHPYKGKCMLFQTYLETHPRAKEYFMSKMGFYQKSILNKDAYIKDVMKYSSEIVVGAVDCSKFEQAIENVIWILDSHQFGTRDYITCGETIYNSLNMKAAVGALYGGKKRDFFDGYTPEMIEEVVKQSCKRLYMGKLGIWNGSLKGELRPKEKVDAGKTRSFTAAPIDTLLGGKVCVDDFNNRFYDLNLKCPWSVGMTKFYGGWNTLMDYFPENWIYCDADGSQFDSSLSPYLINAVLRIRLNFMEEWDIGEQMLKNLYTEIIYTPILTPDGTIIKKFKGNNSGQPSTVVDNSLMVMLAMQYSLLQVGIQWEYQQDVCRYMINGDDLLVAVEPKHEFILDSLQQHFLNLGLKYEFDSRTKDKSDLWFMSHKAIKIGDKWIPKLEEERIVSILEWDRSEIPEHRVEAICASMIEAWGYPELIAEIRRFYLWVLDQQPYAELARRGRIPYITDAALRKLYTNEGVKQYDIEKYLAAYNMDEDDGDDDELNVYHQAETKVLDAGATSEDDGSKVKSQSESKEKEKEKEKEVSLGSGGVKSGESSNDKQVTRTPDKDINAGTTSGTWKLPRIKEINDKMVLPRVKGKIIVNLDHLLQYAPAQSDISNKKATHDQLAQWYHAVGTAFKVQDKPDQMGLILNGFMIWCIENGTSHSNTDGNWVMMEGDEQVSYPLAPMIENAKPSLRQIMTHFSNLAEAYITRRNQTEPYMPRYGLIRNLNDMSLARYAFDFYEVTSKTPKIAREAHFQMKAAALRGKTTRLFGLDGNVGSSEENTERHTTDDVNRNMHTLLGMAPRSM